MDTDELYQAVILDHARKPRNFGPMAAPDAQGFGDNPSCGDEVTCFLKLRDGNIEAANFAGHGCAICMASASLMTQHVKGKPCAHARDLAKEFHAAVTAEGEGADPLREFPGLQALSGVRRFPQRVKCATLAWHALLQALD